MQFSLFFFSSDAAGADPGNRYRLFLDGARYADQNGFTAIWIPERHFHAFGGVYPNPSVLASALAMTTERIRLRAGSVVLPLHHPLRVAEEWAVVDNLSGGRVDLAFATGWNVNDFVLAPDNYSRRQQALFAELETVKSLWKGGSVTIPNGFGEPKETRVFPRPIQDELNFWVTCTGGAQRFTEAGAIGANILTALLFQSVEELAEKLAAYRRARAENGFDPDAGHVTLMLHTYVGADLDEVRETVREPFTEYLKTSADLWRQDSPRLVRLLERKPDMLFRAAFERYFQSNALFGTPETLPPMVQRFWEAGVDELAGLIDFGIAEDTVLDGLQYLRQLQDRCADDPAEERPDISDSVRTSLNGRRKQKIVKFAPPTGAAGTAVPTAPESSRG